MGLLPSSAASATSSDSATTSQLALSSSLDLQQPESHQSSLLNSSESVRESVSDKGRH